MDLTWIQVRHCHGRSERCHTYLFHWCRQDFSCSFCFCSRRASQIYNAFMHGLKVLIPVCNMGNVEPLEHHKHHANIHTHPFPPLNPKPFTLSNVLELHCTQLMFAWALERRRLFWKQSSLPSSVSSTTSKDHTRLSRASTMACCEKISITWWVTPMSHCTHPCRRWCSGLKSSKLNLLSIGIYT